MENTVFSLYFIQYENDQALHGVRPFDRKKPTGKPHETSWGCAIMHFKNGAKLLKDSISILLDENRIEWVRLLET